MPTRSAPSRRPASPSPPPTATNLQTGVDALGKEIDDLRTALKDKPALLDLLPDVQIYYNAVRYALTYNEFYDVKQVATAKAFLKQGQERAKASARRQVALDHGDRACVARGYVSQDRRLRAALRPGRAGVVQGGCGRQAPARPLVPRPRREPDRAELHRRLPEVARPSSCRPAPSSCASTAAIAAPTSSPAKSTPGGDGHVKKHYPIDENRVVIRGFSMGGAACWHFAVHYPSVWAAAAPGAGFSETADFLKVFQNEAVKPTWYEQKLYHMYDATDYAGNLFNCPTVAYSGDDDTQKQAADMMVAAAKREG